MKHIFIIILSFLCLQTFLILRFFDIKIEGGQVTNTVHSSAYQGVKVAIDPIHSQTHSIFISDFSRETIKFDGNSSFQNNSTSVNYLWSLGEDTRANGLNVSKAYQHQDRTTHFTAKDDIKSLEASLTQKVVAADNIINVNNAADLKSFFTLEQLMNTVLLSGGCTAISEVDVSVHAPGDYNNKSYGYFSKGGAAGFPFDEGIILSTGSAASAGNEINSKSISTRQFRAGDTDLEAALGISNTKDATYIKFTFTPDSDTISFRYIMASEEYDRGDYECKYSDGFAFLLREVGTTTYTNLAVLPDGTPVSVSNISNGNKCSNNSEYFEGYNLGHTNFDGQTKVLTASATVIPNRQYEIKLVVADQVDDRWDSAIFLETGSFNLGSGLPANLGQDLTIDDNTAGCLDQGVTLNTKLSYGDHTWSKDGVIIANEKGTTLEVDSPGIYTVDVIFPGGCPSSDIIIVEFYDPVAIDQPEDLSGCQSINGLFNFNLTYNNSIVLGGLDDSEYGVSYFESLINAENDLDPIPMPMSYTGIDNQTIYVRVENYSSGCFSTDSFTLTTQGDFELELPVGIFTANLVTEVFSKINTIEATMIGNGIYEYSLDGGEWQNSNIFNGVAGGVRVIRVRDVNSCGFASASVMVVDYPRYFTPNDDGYNDTWNIVDLDEIQPQKIYIFDRYGKLLKEINTRGAGWNGTFNGQLMPNSDYWFTLMYREPKSGVMKELRAHFTLKR